MNSLILAVTTRFLSSLLLLASLFLLWRGHNQPGGGFAGGLMAASAFVLMALSTGPQNARRALRMSPQSLIAGGLAIALSAGIIGLAAGDSFLAGKWLTLDGPGIPETKLGTPLLFDVGVYLVVVGIGLTIILSLMEEED